MDAQKFLAAIDEIEKVLLEHHGGEPDEAARTLINRWVADLSFHSNCYPYVEERIPSIKRDVDRLYSSKPPPKAFRYGEPGMHYRGAIRSTLNSLRSLPNMVAAIERAEKEREKGGRP